MLVLKKVLSRSSLFVVGQHLFLFPVLIYIETKIIEILSNANKFERKQVYAVQTIKMMRIATKKNCMQLGKQ